MTRRTKVGIGAAALVLAAALVVFSGVLPIAASDGHWLVTEKLLHFTMRRTVKARALGTAVPPLDAHSLVLRGATHYETGCRPCHGAPGSRPPATLRNMTPAPPMLVGRVGEWNAAELFWIVKHGIKFTGMPGWPDQRRDDEVWAMVSFLRMLPPMSEEAYARLALGQAEGGHEHAAGDRGHQHAAGVGEHETPASRLTPLDAQPPARATGGCHRCHGRGAGAFPRLAGQRREYLENALRAYSDGRRHSGIMRPIAAALSPSAISELAAHFSGETGTTGVATRPVDPGAVARGAAIARDGIPAQRVPACRHCHGPADAPRNPAYPRLAGQYAEYLRLQLELFAEDRRGGSAYAHLMRPVARGLRPEQRDDVAAYFASLPPE